MIQKYDNTTLSCYGKRAETLVRKKVNLTTIPPALAGGMVVKRGKTIYYENKTV